MGDPQESTKPLKTHISNTKKLRSFYILSSIILAIAILLSFYKNPILKTFLSPEKHNFLKNTQKSNINSRNCVLWMAPFLSGGGYSSEAWSYITSLHEKNKKNENNNNDDDENNTSFKMSIYQHGDLENEEFWNGLSEKTRNLAMELYQTKCQDYDKTVVICHSEPGAWFPPMFQTTPCPPLGYGKFKVVIGRTMFETDRVNVEHVKRCNKMDFVWVPTDFHVKTFVESGVDKSKVVKIVQPVDDEFFDPRKCEPLDVKTRASLVVGSSDVGLDRKGKFVFLSIFKWEYRKGWDVLLQAYLKEFSGSDGVALYLLTNPYHTGHDFGNKIIDFVEKSGLVKPVGDWAPVYVIDAHIPQVDLPRVYKAVDAFVLPSRGEGWGRPIVEAMSMSLPVITTNWSGPTEYITEENSYPLEVDFLSEVTEGPFKGHLWAEPSVDRLRVLMRRVMSNPEEGKDKGRKAREDMVSGYSPEIVAGIVTEHLERIF